MSVLILIILIRTFQLTWPLITGQSPTKSKGIKSDQDTEDRKVNPFQSKISPFTSSSPLRNDDHTDHKEEHNRPISIPDLLSSKYPADDDHKCGDPQRPKSQLLRPSTCYIIYLLLFFPYILIIGFLLEIYMKIHCSP